ncbi:galactose-specific lectin nattectin-like [Clupea harengus]|uniref:Galactose-specific lectin nattectin-like n=1 Tax=Clupea harengus TaxID=7950 RepID=A0A8M1KD84_CLUHA|nr:galactose-specific lectin nattectin-like [Clupea harengus]
MASFAKVAVCFLIACVCNAFCFQKRDVNFKASAVDRQDGASEDAVVSTPTPNPPNQTTSAGATEATTDGETEEQLSDSSEAPCEQGWTRHAHRCFRFFSTSLPWSEAEGYCVKNGGNLASIHNIKEARLVGELSGNRDWAWIGGGGSSEGFVWYWTDGSAFDYSNWHAWEPNNHGGNEHCINTNYNAGGVWNDSPCHSRFSFVCAK